MSYLIVSIRILYLSDIFSTTVSFYYITTLYIVSYLGGGITGGGDRGLITVYTITYYGTGGEILGAFFISFYRL